MFHAPSLFIVLHHNHHPLCITCHPKSVRYPPLMRCDAPPSFLQNTLFCHSILSIGNYASSSSSSTFSYPPDRYFVEWINCTSATQVLWQVDSWVHSECESQYLNTVPVIGCRRVPRNIMLRYLRIRQEEEVELRQCNYWTVGIVLVWKTDKCLPGFAIVSICSGGGGGYCPPRVSLTMLKCFVASMSLCL